MPSAAKPSWAGPGLLAGWLACGPVAAGGALASLLVRYPAETTDLLHRFWPLAGLVFAILMALALVPTTVAALLAGYVGGWGSLVPMVPAYLLACLAGYGLGRRLQPAWLLAWMESKRMAGAIARLQAGGFSTVFWARLSPVLPFGIGNLAMAWAGIRLKPFFWGSLGGMMPRTLLAIYAGMEARNLAEALSGGKTPASAPWLLGGFVVAAGYGLWRILAARRVGAA